MALRLSASKRIAYKDTFLDFYGQRPPARVQLADATEANGECPERITSWSAFPSTKKPRRQLEKGFSGHGGQNRAGEHVAVAFNQPIQTPSLDIAFHVAVFRCDTWSLQWTARASSAKDTDRVTCVQCLSSNIVAFLMESNGDESGDVELYIATKYEVQEDVRHNDCKWKSFMTDASAVVTGFREEGVSSIQALSETSLLVLTGAGRLLRVNVLFSTSVELTTEEVAFLGMVGKYLPAKHDAPKLVVSCGVADNDADATNGGNQTYICILNGRGSKCYVLNLANPFVDGEVQHITFPKGTVVERIESAGPYMLVATLFNKESKSYALQFSCLVPQGASSDHSFTIASFDLVHLKAYHIPLGTMYNSKTGTHIIVARWLHGNEEAPGNDDTSEGQWWRRMVYAELPLGSGPYSTEDLHGTVWNLLPEPFRPAAPVLGVSTQGVVDDTDDGDAAEAEYVQELSLLSKGTSGGLWAPLRLHYALATPSTTPKTSSGQRNQILATVFAIETAPPIHSRLARQWHNGAVGLLHLLRCTVTCEEGHNQLRHVAAGLPPFAVPWNPRHLRQALRRLCPVALGTLFSSVAGALRRSAHPEAARDLFFGAAATAVVDVAMHIITLSRKVGAQLHSEDVETVVLLLRASRELGHTISKHAVRSQLLMECMVKDRMAARVFNGSSAYTNAGIESGGDEMQTEESRKGGIMFFGGTSEMRVERLLSSRYAVNDWSQRLLLRKSRDAAVVARSRKYLSEVVPFLQHNQQQQVYGLLLPQQEGSKDGGSNEGDECRACREKVIVDALLPDWVFVGHRPHKNAGFAEYEGVLLQDGVDSN